MAHASGTFDVAPKGTGDLVGLSGKLTIINDHGKHSYEFE